MYSPTVTTRLVALLGMPLGHSLSPLLHNRMYDIMGMDYLYLPIEVNNQNLAAVVAGMRVMPYAGCNITIPHKINIISLLDRLDPLAEKIGAVNTVSFYGGSAIGYNTDGIGFIRLLKEEGIAFKNRRICIFGAGGAARAIAITLAEYGVGEILLCNRTQKKAESLAREISTMGYQVQSIPYQKKAIIASAQTSNILINTTSCGMTPDSNLPCPEEAIMPHHTVVDIVYNPLHTPLLATAQSCGAKAVCGIGMLIHQAVAAFFIFTGKKADPTIMRKEAEKQSFFTIYS